MATANATAAPSRWELAAELVAIKIRWFGLLVGCLLANLDGSVGAQRPLLNAILSLGAGYALLDTYFSLRGRVFLGRYPLVISGMEALFIGLLCYCHGGLESPFRYYYLLSLVCCAIRQPSRITYTTYALHCFSYLGLYLALPLEARQPAALVLTLVVLGWVTWACDALAMLLKHIGDHLARLNAALRENQEELEARIGERTRELHEAQAHLLHQEKVAAFGLLAAGIAHEVGNPLTAISSLVQVLQRRDADAYTREKLALVSGQLARIQTTLRELVNFSRPTSTAPGRASIADILDEALHIAKYYKRTKGRVLETQLPPDLPTLYGVRDQLVQVFLNLILNAVDATKPRGHITITAAVQNEILEVAVRDDGCGVAPEQAGRLFQPYFTTKRHGTGLGLFVSHKLVAAHGGTLVHEPAAGGGAVFRVLLPLDRSAPGRLIATLAPLPTGEAR
jgi:signal transduction histidine kinase